VEHSHSICVFETGLPERDYWYGPIYKTICQYISKGYAVIYILEPDAVSTIRRMSKMGIQVEDYVESGALNIISNDIFYSPLVAGSVLIEQWFKLITNIEKKMGRPKGYVAMGMPTSSFFTSIAHQQHLVEYESAFAENYDGSIEAICCYTTDSMRYMPLKHIIGLLNAHQNTVHRDYTLKQWSNPRGLSIIRRGLNEALGSHASSLLLSILSHHYALNEEDPVSCPDRFEDNLRKVLCSGVAEMILEKVKAEFMKEFVF
jgi:MEDS: MEthanogen/methylotroph, DcmR Sensory domain